MEVADYRCSQYHDQHRLEDILESFCWQPCCLAASCLVLIISYVSWDSMNSSCIFLLFQQPTKSEGLWSSWSGHFVIVLIRSPAADTSWSLWAVGQHKPLLVCVLSLCCCCESQPVGFYTLSWQQQGHSGLGRRLFMSSSGTRHLNGLRDLLMLICFYKKQRSIKILNALYE